MKEPLHGYRVFRSGQLRLLYRHGELRQVCLGETQVLNAIYGAVRDQNWSTIPGRVIRESIREKEDGVEIDVELTYEKGEISFDVQININATHKQLDVSYTGTSRSSFLRNRIGLCVLHPIKECIGKPAAVEHPDGTQSQGVFPENIRADQAFRDIAGITWSPEKGVQASLKFHGEIFETEDQRNWTDASFKTYCTPLEKPFPVRIESGEQVQQSLSLVLESDDTYCLPEPPGTGKLRIHSDSSLSLPAIGIGRSTHGVEPSEKDFELLGTIPFHHYGVDLWLMDRAWKKTYMQVLREQDLLKWPIALILHFSEDSPAELNAFLEYYSRNTLNISRIAIVDAAYVSGKSLLEQVLPLLRASFPTLAIGGGTDAYFAELNRNRPDSHSLDFITFSICPQVHASDELTLIENLAGQSEVVRNTREIFQKPVHLGAITLKQRFNVVATDEEDGSISFPETDERQHTAFAASWTLGSIKQLAQSEASSLSYFETLGPRGILPQSDSSINPSPLFYLFKEVLSADSVRLLLTESSHPLEFDGLCLQTEKENVLVLSNHTESEKTIHIEGLKKDLHKAYTLGVDGWKTLSASSMDPHRFSLQAFGIYKIHFKS